MNPRTSLSDLVARLESADHTIAYFNQPLPEILLDGLRLLAGRRGRGSVDLVVEQIDECPQGTGWGSRLESLYSAAIGVEPRVL